MDARMPELYAKKHGLDFEAAKELVVGEYMKISSDKLEWYNPLYWLGKFELKASTESFLERFEDHIETIQRSR